MTHFKIDRSRHNNVESVSDHVLKFTIVKVSGSRKAMKVVWWPSYFDSMKLSSLNPALWWRLGIFRGWCNMHFACIVTYILQIVEEGCLPNEPVNAPKSTIPNDTYGRPSVNMLKVKSNQVCGLEPNARMWMQFKIVAGQVSTSPKSRSDSHHCFMLCT